MENTNSAPPKPETFVLELLTTSINEARESGQIVSSSHESYALLLERLEAYWRAVRNRCDSEVLLDLLINLATQCVTTADDLFVARVIADNNEEAN